MKVLTCFDFANLTSTYCSNCYSSLESCRSVSADRILSSFSLFYSVTAWSLRVKKLSSSFFKIISSLYWISLNYKSISGFDWRSADGCFCSKVCVLFCMFALFEMNSWSLMPLKRGTGIWIVYEWFTWRLAGEVFLLFTLLPDLLAELLPRFLNFSSCS